MHEVLVDRLGGVRLPRKSLVSLTDRPEMPLDVYRGRKTTIQQQQQHLNDGLVAKLSFTKFVQIKVLGSKMALTQRVLGSQIKYT